MTNRPLTHPQIWQRMRDDGITVKQISKWFGVKPSSIRAQTRSGRGRDPLVPTGPLRHKRLHRRMSYAEVARRMDWYTSAGKADGSRVARALNRPSVRAATALKLADALGVDIHELDL